MITYLLGWLLNLPKTKVSKIALVDSMSVISPRAKVNYRAKIYSSTINDYSYIGPRSDLVCADIGKYCSIAADCLLGLASHTVDHMSTSPLFTQKKNGTGTSWAAHTSPVSMERVVIGHDVWIGARAIILSGVRVGNGVVIGAGAVVTKDVPDYAIAVGVPARTVRYRFGERERKMLTQLEWWDWSPRRLQDRISFFQRSAVTPELIAELQKAVMEDN